MPSNAVKLCPRCKRLMPVGRGDTYCPSCAAEYRRERPGARDWHREYVERQQR